jgi:endonuclease/exonuclease/phosphatase (EEP) superfamily protein YafD
MMSWIFPLILLFSFEVQARRPSGYWTELVPLAQAHRYFGQAEELELDPGSIKTLVWNIKKTEKKEWQREFLDYMENQDLVLLQEGLKNERFLSTTAQRPELRWDMAVSFLLRQSNRAATGTLIGSTVAPSHVVVSHTEDFEPIVNTPKATIFAKYPLAGTQQELLVISIHGINLTSLNTFRRHLQQARAQIQLHDGPVFFAGDFNTRTKARTSYMMKMMCELNLTPVTFKNGDRRMVWKFTRNYLDHGFVRGLKVLSAEVLADSRGSDHKPMVLELALKEVHP